MGRGCWDLTTERGSSQDRGVSSDTALIPGKDCLDTDRSTVRSTGRREEKAWVITVRGSVGRAEPSLLLALTAWGRAQAEAYL